MYTTTEDYLESMTIKIFQGNRTLSKDNYQIGQIHVTFDSKNQRSNIDIKFSLDENNMLSVEVVDLITQRSFKGTIDKPLIST